MAVAEDLPGAAVRRLEADLHRYPADRYPVQHATARFHLGTMRMGEGRLDDAITSLRTAVRLFVDLPVERAKATNMLGVALRSAGATQPAVEAFSDAERTFGAHQRPLEQAAATYNLGLAALDQGDLRSASGSFRRAADGFADEGALAQASAARRELAGLLLTLGRVDEALGVAEDAVAAAEQAGDRAAIGGASNVLGLAHLALGQAQEAVAAFQATLGAHPRGLRPEGYAMAKANLALAHEALADWPRARLAARQARDTPGAPPVARDHALAVLDRLTDGPDDLMVVLDREDVDRWPGVVREELVRWLDLGPEAQRRAAAAWVDGQVSRPRAVDRADAWLGVVLELPPDAAGRLIHLLVDAVGDRDEADSSRLRGDTARAMAHFHVPQMLRLRDAFEETTASLGRDGSWS